jgi:hypothetical protein
MAIDGRLQPAVAACSTFAAFAWRIAGALRLERGYLDNRSTTFFVFMATTARARIVSTSFHCVSYLSFQGFIMT